MSSYADVNQAARRSRYRSRPVPRRERHRVKAGRVLLVLGVLLVVMTRAAYGTGRTGTEKITVQPGQTVWSIAAGRYPDDDTRERVGEIIQLNHLAADQGLYAGESLSVPAR
ncbi:MAG TPA: LysM peptidoglycan-binding domain-containing protein [Candidatus Dormibacteraeota bacterium]|jgi:hypothetical protein|nr:LysM peptidoglycan-binding domain-containing protein [Candidatus Dormibacteraeota bacterium]